MAKYRDNGVNVGSGAIAASYGRISSTMQRAASLEDQARNCAKYAEENQWIIKPELVTADEAKSGRKLSNRDGLNTLMALAKAKPRGFDILIADEPSRLGRNVEHVIKITKKLKHYGIVVAFASRRMRSDDPNFEMMLTFHAMSDQMSSEELADRVHRGHEGRVLAGYATGSRCFGYRSETIPDPSRTYAQGRASTLGVKWVVIPSEAATINLIYQLFADGWSSRDITFRLNGEKVPAARNTRIDDPPRYWNENLVKRILQNKKYIGQVEWNKTNQSINPDNEHTETQPNPREVWVCKDVPELRIVGDELWDRVQARLVVVNEKMTRHRMGGLNRSKRHVYLFSGLLYCGECGSPITIGGTGGNGRGAAYGCVSRRNNRGCTNNLWIREDRLSAQLLQALTKNLLQPAVMDYFIASVAEEFDACLKGKRGASETPLDALKAEETQHKAAISRLVATIMNPYSANSDALPAMLAQKEADLKRVQNDIALLAAPKNLSDAKVDIEALVQANINNLQQIILQEPLKAREVFQRYVKGLTLFPTVTEEGDRAYEVVGELDLFASPDTDKDRILLARSKTGIVQQYTHRVDFAFRFAGLVLDPNIDPWVNPLIAPLAGLLASTPAFLHDPKRALDWVGSLKPRLAEDTLLYERLNADYMSWNLRHHADLFEKNFGMVSLKIGRDTYYMFTRPEPEGDLASTPVEALAG